MTTEEESLTVNEKRWHALALVYGYNELAKLAPTLGEKVYCRLMCLEYEAEYRKLGGEIEMRGFEAPVVVIVGQHMPHINLYERDIELMRKAVADFDAAKVRG